MIYDKPRNIRLRIFPSPFSRMQKSNVKKAKKKVFPDNLIIESDTQQSFKAVVPPVVNENVDIILQGKPTFIQEAEMRNNAVIDVSKMPVIDGIPMLDLPGEEIIAEEVATPELQTQEANDIFKDNSNVVSFRDFKEEKNKQSTEASEEFDSTSTEEILSKPIDFADLKDNVPVDIPILEFKEDEIPADKVQEETITEPAPSKAEIKEKLKQEKIASKQAEKDKKAEEKLRKKQTKEDKKQIRKDAKAEKTAKKKAEKENRKKAKTPINRTHLVKIGVFLLTMYAGAILSFWLPLRPTYSETEKRQLAKFPEFSTEALLSGDYFEGISTWFADTFPFREQLMSANTSIKELYGIDSVSIHGDIESGDDIPDDEIPEEPEVTEPVTEEKKPVKMPTADELKEDNGNADAKKPNFKAQKLGAIIVAGDSGYEYYSFSKKLAPRFINAVNKVESQAKPTGKVYALVAPTSIDIKLNDALRADINSANQKKALDYFNASFKNAVAVDGIYDAEREHRDEYTYFRTDHHWTALGAYYAYEQFAIEKGVRPIPISSYKTKTFKNFKGTFYSNSKQSKKLGKKPDYVTAYLPMNNTSCTLTYANGKSRSWDVIRDASDYGSGSKYLTFIGGDFPLITIKNHDNPTNTSCVVIKDSYGNSFVPFLIPHYSTVYVIDPRHYEKSLSSFCKDKEITDVVIMTNISVTRNSIFISAFENLLR